MVVETSREFWLRKIDDTRNCLLDEIKHNHLMITKIMSPFKGEKIQTLHNDLLYRIDLYFHDYKLGIKTDKYGHCARNIGCE